MINFNFLVKGLGIVSPEHFVYDIPMLEILGNMRIAFVR